MRSILLAAPLLVVCATAMAKAEPPRGPYFGLGIGQADLVLDGQDSPLDFGGGEAGLRFMVGWRILEWMAIEALYGDYSAADDDFFAFEMESEFRTYQVNGVLLLPVDEVDLFAKAGIGYWKGSLRSPARGATFRGNEVDMTVGLGVQWRLGRFAVRTEADGQMHAMDSGGDDWITYVGVGVTYAF